MSRAVFAELDLEVGPSVDLIFSIALAQNVDRAYETLTFSREGRTFASSELVGAHGSRLHRLTAEAGLLQVRYEARVDAPSALAPTAELDTISYLRPSRYCQSDEVFTQARSQFTGLAGAQLIQAVSEYVYSYVTYAPGFSLGTDSATTTLFSGQGVCRDFAHLTIALLRAMDVPARYVSCYAPGLDPMDFHAVAEAYLDGSWWVIDSTRLADRRSLVRIATGRDASDCAFLSFHGGSVGMPYLFVNATRDDDAYVGDDDFVALVQMT